MSQQSWQIPAIFRTTASAVEMNRPLEEDEHLSIAEATELVATIGCDDMDEATTWLLGEGFSLSVATEAALQAEPSWRA